MHAPWTGNDLLDTGKARRVVVDARGEVYDRSVQGKGNSLKQPIELQTASGLCTLRKLDTSGLRKKDAEAAIDLWAQESLPKDPDQYLTCSWKISNDVWGLAAIALEPLESARESLSGQIKKLIVPELTPPTDSRCGAIVWLSPYGLTVCYWRAGVLCDWQSFSKSATPETVRSQVWALTDSEDSSLTPEWLVFESEPPDNPGSLLYNAIAESWPDASLSYMADWSPAEAQRWFAKGRKFDQFIHQARYQPVDSAGKSRLAFAFIALLVAGCFFIFSDLDNLEKRVEVLRQQDLVLSVKARRSEQVAKRSSDALTQIYDLQTMTIERRGIMHVLKALEDTLPPGAKLLDLDIQRNGDVTVNGSAQSEVDINSFLDRLERVDLLRNPKLIFSQQESNLTASTESADKLIRFNIELQLAEPLLLLPGSADTDAYTDVAGVSGHG